MPKSSGAKSGGGSGGASRLSRPSPTRTKTARGLRSWAPSRSSFAAAEGVTLAAIVTYDVMGYAAGGASTKLPRPGPIVATMAFYALIAAVGSISRTFEPLAVAVGWVLALSVIVTGKRGAGIVALLQRLAGLVGKLGGDTTAPAATG